MEKVDFKMLDKNLEKLSNNEMYKTKGGYVSDNQPPPPIFPLND